MKPSPRPISLYSFNNGALFTAAPTSGLVYYGNDYSQTLYFIGQPEYSAIYTYGGDDRIYIDRSNILIDGGTGVDTVNFSTSATRTKIYLDNTSVAYSLFNVEIVYGSNQSDIIDASRSSTSRTLFGQNGNDFIRGGGGADALYGGAGADDLFGGLGSGSDSIYGESGNDTIYGNATGLLSGGADDDRFIISWFQYNTIDGGTGFDTLDLTTGQAPVQFTVDANFGVAQHNNNYGRVSFAGIEQILGSSYNDSFYVNESGFNIAVDGGSGFDSISYNPFQRGLTLQIDSLNITSIEYFYATSFDDVITTDNVAFALLAGGAGNDTIRGQFYNSDIIHGDNGNDVIYGRGGVDSLYGDGGDDIIYGRGGVYDSFMYASLSGGAGNDTLRLDNDAFNATDESLEIETLINFSGGDGVNTIDLSTLYYSGTRSTEILHFESFFSILEGYALVTLNNFVDDIYYLAGIEFQDVTQFIGSSGDDYFAHMKDGYFTIDGGLGLDLVQYGDLTHGINLQLDNAASFNYLKNVENIGGTDYNDVLTGNNQSNAISDAGGSDTVYGLGGDDTLYSGLGDDRLDGGVGRDFFQFGLGSDTVIGGSDVDTFSPISIDQFDVITDFTVGLGGDILNINRLLSSNTNFFANRGNINDYVRIVDGFYYDTAFLQVDSDGAGTNATWQNVLIFQNIQGTSLQDLINNNQLVIV